MILIDNTMRLFDALRRRAALALSVNPRGAR